MAASFLTSTSAAIQPYTVPSGWNASSNTVEAIGPGGNGSARQSSTRAGTGGGGGSYAKRNNVNLTAGSSVNYFLPAGGSGLDAWFNDQNLLLQTDNSIGVSPWGLDQVTVSQSQAGPGSVGNVATRIIESTSNSTHACFQDGTMRKPASVSTAIIYVVYLKANGSRNAAVVLADNGFSNGAYAIINLGASTVNASGTFGSGWSITSTTPSSAGGGWTKVIFLVTANTSATTFSASTDLYNGSFSNSYTGDGSSGVDIYGATVRFGTIDAGFTPTTSTPAYSILAKAGTNGTTSAAGVGQSGSLGDTTAQGGNGNRPATSVTTGGGGGGSAGPNGAGGNASTSTGGSADNGTVAGASAGNNGNSGTEFDGTHGCGSGAGGRSGNGAGFVGGAYGGGGSGCGVQSGQAGGAGAQALIVINADTSGGAALVNVVPGAAEIAGSVPTATATANRLIRVVPGALAVTGSTPTVTATDHKTVAVVPGAASITGSAPTVTVTTNTLVRVVAGAASIAGSVPTVATTANALVRVVPGVAQIVGSVPTVAATSGVTVDVVPGAAALTGSVPTVTATANVVVLVVPGAAQIAGAVPTVSVTSDEGTTTDAAFYAAAAQNERRRREELLRRLEEAAAEVSEEIDDGDLPPAAAAAVAEARTILAQPVDYGGERAALVEIQTALAQLEAWLDEEEAAEMLLLVA